MHLLCGPVNAEAWASAPASVSPTPAVDDSLTDRIAELEARVAALEARLDQ